MEPFTLIEKSEGPQHLFDKVVECGSAPSADHDLQYVTALRKANPDMIVTAIPVQNTNLRAFAAAGNAMCELDTKTDSFSSWRGYIVPRYRTGSGQLGEVVHFAKYHYHWNGEDFMLFTVDSTQYVLKERGSSEHALGPSHITDKLILTVGEWQSSDFASIIWVYDNYWQKSRALWEDVKKASWDKVILDEKMKKDLTSTIDKFFDSKDVYEDIGVPWKRGLIFGGPPGNGKTISVKALAHSLLFDRKDPIPTLYVKNAPQTYHIRSVFTQARKLAPCMLVLEDIETIVTSETRSYFLNEMDGLENNDGLFVVASTNYLDRLDPGLSKRPSRFDRVYNFPLPNEHERTLYCQYWQHKLRNKPKIKFPDALCGAMARITDGFSFAFLQEAFVSTLLVLVRRDESLFHGSLRGYQDLPLWQVFKQQVELLRQGMGKGDEDEKSAVGSLPLAGLHIGDGGGMADVGLRGGRARYSSDVAHYSSERGMLPPLPYYDGKSEIINSAAYELV